jgi:DNA-binding transcriptional ArsR family regulator
MRALSNEQMQLVAERSRALGDYTRVRILDALARSEQPVGTLAAALDSEPSTVSKHLQVLFRAKLVARRRDGSAVIYSIAAPALLNWCRFLGAADPARAAQPPTAAS